MNKQRSIQLLFGSVIIALFAGCAMLQMGGNSPVGTWTNQYGTVWMIKADGTFVVDLKHHGKVDASGTYKIEGDQITLQRTGGVNPKGCSGPGVYKVKRDGDSLTFTFVSDQCGLRKKNVLAGWHAKK
jgi:hypothetical protein